MKPEVRTLFDKACDALKVSPETRDARWRLLSDLGLSAHDEVVIALVADGRMEELQTRFAKTAASVNGLPEAIAKAVRTASTEAVGPVAEAAKMELVAAHATMAADTAGQVATLTAERLDGEFRARRFRDMGLVAAVALALALLVGWMGYGLGARTIAELDASVRAIAARPDLSTVLRILTGNPNLDAVIGSYCASGSSAVRVVEGVRNCSLPLWIDGRPASLVPSYGGQPILTMWNSGAAVLNRFSGWTILLSGLVLGLILKRLFAVLGKIVGFKVVST